MQNVTKKNVAKKSGQASKTNNKNKRNKRKKALFVVLLIFIIALAIYLLFFSGLFNIKEITVENNSRVSSQDIISMSGLEIGKNMFRPHVKEKVKSNAYIKDVKIIRKINGEVVIKVEEREPTYMIRFEEKYAYINNQGYILEINENPISVPEIIGYSEIEMKPGDRLQVNDLEKLNVVIQIMDTAANKGMKDIIEKIDISNANDFFLEIPSESKTIEFGDGSDVRYKLDWVEEILTKTKGEEGTIVVKNAVTKAPFFREKV